MTRVLLGLKSRVSYLVAKLPLRKLLLGLGIIGFVFILINLGTYFSYKNRTYPNAHVENFSIGSISYKDLDNKLKSLALIPKTITLNQHGKNLTVSTSDLGIQANNGKIEANIRQNSWLPIANLFSPHNSSIVLKVNKPTLTSKLMSLAENFNRQPSNANIRLQNGRFILADSIEGSSLNVDQSAKIITSAINKDEPVIALPFVATDPQVTNASLKGALEKLQAEQNVNISYSYNGKSTKPDASVIANWYVVNSDNNYEPSPSKIAAYLNQVGSSYGIRIANINSATTGTINALNKASSLNFSLTAVPNTVCSSSQINQLIVVSISEQEMWVCSNYSLVYTSAVTTGAYELAGDSTPTGTWHIYAKERDVHLTGPTWNDFVNYWMPFYSDYGFHDATWQTFPFGGPEYPTQGSHGCVHLPLNAVQWLYNWASIGATVTVKQ